MYGQTVKTPFPLEGLRPIDPAKLPDITVEFGPIRGPRGSSAAPERTSALKSGTHFRFWETELGFLFLTYFDGPRFAFAPCGDRIWIDEVSDASRAELSLYLLGPVLGFALRLRGLLCLHASAFRFGGFAVALVGPSGAGKSTTAAALAALGCTILTDDILALDDRNGALYCWSGYPRLRLWPDSAAQLQVSAAALQWLIPGWEKRYLALDDSDERFAKDPVPLGAVYVLGERRSCKRPGIRGITGPELVLSLVRNTYRNELLSPSMRAQEFRTIERIIETTPIRRAAATRDLTDLGQLCNAILEDVAALIET